VAFAMAMSPCAPPPGVGRNGVFQIAEHHVDLRGKSGTLGGDLFDCGARNESCRSSLAGSSRSGAGAPMASG